jgi:hypothetical protein
VNDWIVLTKENMLAAVLVASGFLIWWSVKFLAREVIIPGRNACLAHLKNTDRCMHERLQRIEARVSKRRDLSESPDEMTTEDEEDEPL